MGRFESSESWFHPISLVKHGYDARKVLKSPSNVGFLPGLTLELALSRTIRSDGTRFSVITLSQCRQMRDRTNLPTNTQSYTNTPAHETLTLRLTIPLMSPASVGGSSSAKLLSVIVAGTACGVSPEEARPVACTEILGDEGTIRNLLIRLTENCFALKISRVSHIAQIKYNLLF